MNPKVDFFFAKAQKWQHEFKALREIILECLLQEELKWGVPCYTYQKHNVVLMHGFKEYCAVLFFKGALLKDAKKHLIQQTKNVQAARQLRFASVKEIQKLKKDIQSYVYEAIEIEKEGLHVVLKKTEEYEFPEELQLAFQKNKSLKKAFEALSPGRKKGYVLYFSSAKQSATRSTRIERCIPNIIAGKGLQE
ncbi:MAG: YdeI/OmpD-associated family protein [Bacteroidetes bacterium]|nr:YdeI/OmpD-associated family protein [Bacteroidota bacterium]